MSAIDHVGSARWRRRWLFVGGGSVAVLAVGILALGTAVGRQRALAWAAIASPLVAYVAWFFYSRRDRESGLGAIRLANAVTVLRGWLFAAVGGFAALPPAGPILWVPGLWYGLGAALDQVDGRLARYTGSESEFGERLDMAVDTMGFAAAPVVAVAWGRLPVWYLLLAAARYLFKLGRGYRQWRGRSVSELTPSSIRRGLAGLQMAFLTLALLPLVAPGTLAVAAVFVLSPSLAMFVRDYLVVAGHYRPRWQR